MTENMYKVNIEGTKIIDYMSLPVLVVFDSEDQSKLDKIMIGSEITDANTKEILVLVKEVQIWLDENIKGKYKLHRADIYFELEEEAILFKTVWI